MIGKFKTGWEGFLPLVTHCAVHASFTLIILFFYQTNMVWLAFVDFVMHMAIDRAKVVWGDRNPQTRKFWRDLGLDQAAHHVTHYMMIYWMLTHAT